MHHTPVTRKLDAPSAKPHRPQSRWLWTAVAGLLVLLGGGLMFRQASESPAPGPFTAVSASPASHSIPADATPKYATKPIRDFRGFEWVLARNPEVAGEERSAFEEVDYREWRWVELELTKPDGDLLKVGLGRPIAWLVVNDITPGATTWLDLPEMGAVGYATILSVAPCPDPGPKPHPDCRLVTGVFRHSSADCVNVHVAGLDSPIGTTRNHRFWSEDRQAFVEAGHLHPGESLLTADGTPTSVLSITARPGLEPVYNLEVDVEHVYYVASDGVLVHNACAVYLETRRGIVRYVGRTLNLRRRIVEHFRKGRLVEGIKDLPSRMSYKQMRALEHRLIEKHGRKGIDAGGTLDNVLRGIDPRKLDAYASQLKWADNIIKKLGL